MTKQIEIFLAGFIIYLIYVDPLKDHNVVTHTSYVSYICKSCLRIYNAALFSNQNLIETMTNLILIFYLTLFFLKWSRLFNKITLWFSIFKTQGMRPWHMFSNAYIKLVFGRLFLSTKSYRNRIAKLICYER